MNSEENAFGKLAARAPALTRVPTFRLNHGSRLGTLTTPISYLTEYPDDPFAPTRHATLAYWNHSASPTHRRRFVIWSPGPDRIYDLNISNLSRVGDGDTTAAARMLNSLSYDPTNGGGSGGDIMRWDIAD